MGFAERLLNRFFGEPLESDVEMGPDGDPVLVRSPRVAEKDRVKAEMAERIEESLTRKMVKRQERGSLL